MSGGFLLQWCGKKALHRRRRLLLRSWIQLARRCSLPGWVRGGPCRVDVVGFGCFCNMHIASPHGSCHYNLVSSTARLDHFNLNEMCTKPISRVYCDLQCLGGSSGLLDCPAQPGSYCPSGSAAPKPCPAGFYCPGGSADSAICQCAPTHPQKLLTILSSSSQRLSCRGYSRHSPHLNSCGSLKYKLDQK